MYLGPEKSVPVTGTTCLALSVQAQFTRLHHLEQHGCDVAAGFAKSERKQFRHIKSFF